MTGYCRVATLPRRTPCCCDYIATPRKSPISCDPEAELGKDSALQSRNSAGGTRETELVFLLKFPFYFHSLFKPVLF
ncbi:MAG: hypothetical protein WB014_02350 [Methanosarcina sp.]